MDEISKYLNWEAVAPSPVVLQFKLQNILQVNGDTTGKSE